MPAVRLAAHIVLAAVQAPITAKAVRKGMRFGTAPAWQNAPLQHISSIVFAPLAILPAWSALLRNASCVQLYCSTKMGGALWSAPLACSLMSKENAETVLVDALRVATRAIVVNAPYPFF